MAKQNKQDQEIDVNEAVRQGARGLLRLGTYGLVVAVIGYIVFMIFVGSNPRRDLASVDELIAVYNEIIAPHVPPNLQPPTQRDVDDILTFFDEDSRSWFKGNVRRLAKAQNINEPEAINDMTSSQIESAAMMWLLSHEPLSGFGGVQESRFPSADTEERVYTTRSRGRATVRFRKSGPTWVILELGGTRKAIEEQIKNITH